MRRRLDAGGGRRKGHTARFPMVLKMMLIYLLLILIPFGVTNIILSRIAENNIYKNTRTYVNLFAEQVSSGIDSYVATLDHMVKVMILDDRLAEILYSVDDSSVSAYESSLYVDSCMLKLMTQHSGISNIAVVGANGRVFTGDSNAIRDMDGFSRTLSLDEVRKDRYSLSFSGAHIPDYLLISPSRPVFCMMRNLYQYDRYIGTIVLYIDQRMFLESVRIAPPVNDIDARIMIKNDRQDVLVDGFLSAVAADAAAPVSPAGDGEDGEEALLFTRRSAYSGLTTTLSVSRDVLFANIREFRRLAMAITVVLLVICLGLAAWFSLRLVRPITTLTRANAQYAAGRYDVRVPVTTSDEIGLLCASFNDMAENLNALMHRVYLHQIKTEEAHFKALQAQINPHFLHNTLESIRMQALINGDARTANMIKMLAQLFRITLDRGHGPATLRQELEHVTLYMALQNVRFNGRFQLKVDIPPALEDVGMLRFSLQPLVENSIMHGFRNHLREDETIEISASEADGMVCVSVCDNGEGMAQEELARLGERLAAANALQQDDPEESGIGLVNIAGRLMLKFGERAGIEVAQNAPSGTRVRLRFPKDGARVGGSGVPDGKGAHEP